MGSEFETGDEMKLRLVFGLALFMAFWTTTAAGQGRLRIRQNADDAFANLEEKFALRFLDAVTGKPIPGARITFEGASATTDREGAVRFAFPADLGYDEKRHALFAKKGYVRAKAAVHFMVGTVFFNRYSVSPTLPPGRIRIALDWAEKPKDLDAHLQKKGVYHLSYREMKKYQDLAWLDRDDRDGHGPETITFLRIDPKASYRYFVHDFTKTGAIGDSKAHVRVYGSKGLLHTFVVPTGAKGDVWKVFEIVNGVVKPIK